MEVILRGPTGHSVMSRAVMELSSDIDPAPNRHRQMEEHHALGLSLKHGYIPLKSAQHLVNVFQVLPIYLWETRCPNANG